MPPEEVDDDASDVDAPEAVDAEGVRDDAQGREVQRHCGAEGGPAAQNL